MKSLVFAALLSSSTSYAMDYELHGCDDGLKNCIYLDSGSSLDYQAFRGNKGGKGMREMVSGISQATGKGVSVIQNTVAGMRDTALAAGFHTFEGKLTGDNVSVTFTFNLNTGAWSFFASGGGDIKPGKELLPATDER